MQVTESWHVLLYSMCSLVVSVLDSPAVDPRSNPDSGSALLMMKNLRLYTTGCHMLIDKALSSNRKVDGSRLTGSTQACHS